MTDPVTDASRVDASQADASQADVGQPAAPPGGRSAIVTAASRGIGLSIASALVALGDRVLITGRDPGRLDAAVAILGPDRAIAVAGKAHDEAHQDAAVTRAVEAFGGIDILVNNVGTNPVYGSLIDQPTDAIRKVLEINLMAALGWTRRVWEASMSGSGGAVVNVSSAAALGPSPGLGAYGMSKAALSYLTAQLAVELAPSVRVNAVAPAVVKTKFAEALYAGREEQLAASYPLGRLGEPADVAGAAVFLLSESASWVTGQTLVLDGGSTLLRNL